MGKCTEQNPAGVTDYNIARFAELPEWHALEKAMNDVANAIGRREQFEGGQDAIAEAVEHLVRGIPYCDCCERCNRSDPRDFEMYAPHVVQIDGDRLAGQYRCERGHYWSCFYSLDAPWHF